MSPPRGTWSPPPCWHCGHADARDASHARGCPALPAVTQAELLALAESCRRGWERDELARKRARGAAA